MDAWKGQVGSVEGTTGMIIDKHRDIGIEGRGIRIGRCDRQFRRVCADIRSRVGKSCGIRAMSGDEGRCSNGTRKTGAAGSREHKIRRPRWGSVGDADREIRTPPGDDRVCSLERCASDSEPRDLLQKDRITSVGNLIACRNITQRTERSSDRPRCREECVGCRGQEWRPAEQKTSRQGGCPIHYKKA